ncbi:MAG: hypothetical protein WB037_04095, partial [Pseudolabrys sp.]
EKIVDGFLQRIVSSQRANLQRNNPEKNSYSPSKATPDPIILSHSLYHGLVARLPKHRLASMAILARIFRQYRKKSWPLCRSDDRLWHKAERTSLGLEKAQ